MNKLIALTTLVVLYNSVQYSSSAPICAITRGHPEKSIMFGECYNANFPAVETVMHNLCYEKTFGSSGSIANFVDLLCAENYEKEKIHAMFECLDEEGAKVPPIDKEELQNAYKGTKSCFLDKLGLTKEEYDTIVQNFYRDNYAYEEDEDE